MTHGDGSTCLAAHAHARMELSSGRVTKRHPSPKAEALPAVFWPYAVTENGGRHIGRCYPLAHP